MSTPTPPGMPYAVHAPAPRPQRPPDRWRTAGVALLAVWGALIVAAILWWVQTAFFPGPTDDVHGYIRFFGAPFVLLALVLLWWVWWSARALRRGRREGWPVLIVLGLGTVAQAVMVIASMVGVSSMDPGTPGMDVEPLRQLDVAAIGTLGFGLVCVVVAGLAVRAWAAADAAATPAGPTTTQGVADRGFTDQG